MHAGPPARHAVTRHISTPVGRCLPLFRCGRVEKPGKRTDGERVYLHKFRQHSDKVGVRLNERGKGARGAVPSWRALSPRCASPACRVDTLAVVPRHHGQEIVAVVAEHAESQHVPQPEYGMVRDELKPAAFPPPAASPFTPPRMFRGRPPQRMRGRSYGQYVVTNEDGTTRLVTVGMR